MVRLHSAALGSPRKSGVSVCGAPKSGNAGSAGANQKATAHSELQCSGTLAASGDFLRGAIDVADHIESPEDPASRGAAEGGVNRLAEAVGAQLSTSSGQGALVYIYCNAGHAGDLRQPARRHRGRDQARCSDTRSETEPVLLTCALQEDRGAFGIRTRPRRARSSSGHSTIGPPRRAMRRQGQVVRITWPPLAADTA